MQVFKLIWDQSVFWKVDLVKHQSPLCHIVKQPKIIDGGLEAGLMEPGSLEQASGHKFVSALKK
jgi:hypothetical protein